MIFIDDAGIGCLVGGIIIGVYDTDTDRFAFMETPPLFFQGRKYEEKAYLRAAGDIAKTLLMQLNIWSHTKTEIHLCTGFCLNGVEQMLIHSGYQYKRTRIGEPLQTKIETALLTTLSVKYGFSCTYEELTSIEKKGLFWWKQIAWLKDGNVESITFNRKKAAHCKSGWATWPAWSEMPYSRAKVEAKHLKAKHKYSTTYFGGTDV